MGNERSRSLGAEGREWCKEERGVVGSSGEMSGV
jgi:hypothetical protein